VKLLAVIVCTVGLCLTWLSIELQPEIAGPKKTFQYVPSTQPTGFPKTQSTGVDKKSLIIQQDVNCWLGGVVGATCGSDRTYL